jgi:hypothetical protein
LIGDKGSPDGKWIHGVCRLRRIGAEPNPGRGKYFFEDSLNVSTKPQQLEITREQMDEIVKSV